MNKNADIQTPMATSLPSTQQSFSSSELFFLCLEATPGYAQVLLLGIMLQDDSWQAHGAIRVEGIKVRSAACSCSCGLGVLASVSLGNLL